MRFTQHIATGLWVLLLSVAVQGDGLSSIVSAQDGPSSVLQPAASPSGLWAHQGHVPSVGKLPTLENAEVEDTSGTSTGVPTTALHLLPASTGAKTPGENRFRRWSCAFLCVFLC